LREGLVRELVKRWSSPLVQTSRQQPRGFGGISLGHSPSPLLDLLLEDLEIELVGLNPKEIPRRTSHEDITSSISSRSKRLAHLRDVHLEGMPGRSESTFSPQRIDQAIGGYHLIGMQEEDGEESPLLRSSKGECLPLLPHLERAEDPELHPTILPLRAR
jgi:hypothetical protein